MNKYVQIAKRERNNKRGFLIVNPDLGKHVPQEPQKILNLFDKTAALFPNGWEPKHTLVIGFAETATALGLHYACKNHCRYMQTTRESVPGEQEYLYFSEEHSHATAQYILKNSFMSHLETINHIMFVDDEITTGKTVLNAIAAIQKECRKEFQYGVTSVINSMTTEQYNSYQEKGIKVYCLERILHHEFAKEAERFQLDGVSHQVPYEYQKSIEAEDISGLPDCRHVISPNYEHVLEQILTPILENFNAKKNVLVLGIEEFMYPGIWFANKLEEQGCIVHFHATTRSPISVSEDKNYPLHNRVCLSSVNAPNRKTFLYNLRQYDHIFVLVEKNYATQAGMDELNEVLESYKNTEIKFFAL